MQRFHKTLHVLYVIFDIVVHVCLFKIWYLSGVPSTHNVWSIFLSLMTKQFNQYDACNESYVVGIGGSIRNSLLCSFLVVGLWQVVGWLHILGMLF